MANTYSLSVNCAGSSQDNAASRTISSFFTYNSTSHKRITYMSRNDGIWCSCGGTSQNVVLQGYDRLINTSTGVTIKTSTTGTCTCYGTGPSSANYMLTEFKDWTQAESDAAISAWATGVLRITRTVSIKSYTSSGHGNPTFRDGYYNDTIVIQGTDAAWITYSPSINKFLIKRKSTDSASAIENPAGEYVYATYNVALRLSNYLSSSRVYIYDQSGNVLVNVVPSALNTDITVKLGSTWSAASDYSFYINYVCGDETSSADSVAPRYAIPLHIHGTNTGVAVGGYSTATTSVPKFEAYFPTYLHGGLVSIGGKEPLLALGVQHGNTGAITVGSNSYVSTTVTFPNAYAASPTVIVSFRTGSTSGNFGRCVCGVYSTSTTECVIRVYNGGDTSRAPEVNWVAFGTLA